MRTWTSNAPGVPSAVGVKLMPATAILASCSSVNLAAGETFTVWPFELESRRAEIHGSSCVPSAAPNKTNTAPLRTGRNAIHRRNHPNGRQRSCKGGADKSSSASANSLRHCESRIPPVSVCSDACSASIKDSCSPRSSASCAEHAAQAARCVAISAVSLLVGFAASVENQQPRNLFALEFQRRAHRRPPSWLRSFRVARNSEFFTVSSVVPNASPMARNFNP